MKRENILTNQRRYEIIKACKELINSPNVTEYGKINAYRIMDKMYCELIYYGD